MSGQEARSAAQGRLRLWLERRAYRRAVTDFELSRCRRLVRRKRRLSRV